MLRGVIRLTNQQISTLKALKLDWSTDLSRRINSLETNLESGNIELNEDEVDQLIDALPAPTTTDQSYNQLRQLLTNWLRQLRSS